MARVLEFCISRIHCRYYKLRIIRRRRFKICNNYKQYPGITDNFCLRDCILAFTGRSAQKFRIQYFRGVDWAFTFIRPDNFQYIISFTYF